MKNSLTGMKIAVLAANGVAQDELVAIQRAVAEHQGIMRIISPDQGLVNGWDGHGWGHNFAVDAQINTALGVDYDAMILPGGQRSLDKLGTTAHTKRFIGGFMAAMKPMAIMGDAIAFMAGQDMLAGRTVAMPIDHQDMMATSGATLSEALICTDDMMMSGQTGDNLPAFMDAIMNHFMRAQDMAQAA